MEKKKNRKELKTWQKLVLGLIATVLAAVALELYCNRGSGSDFRPRSGASMPSKRK